MISATFSPRANRDLGEAARWIGRDSRTAAHQLRQVILDAAVRLAKFPLAGASRPEIVRAPFRILPLRGFPYLVVYDPRPTPPQIVRVVHGARDLPDLLRDL